MYKKTTTTIVEEHGPKPATLVNPFGPDAVTLKLNLRDRLSLYTADMRNYVISKVNGTEDVPHLVDQLRTDVQLLVNTMQPFFGQDQLIEFSTVMTDVTISMVTVIDAMASKTEFDTAISATKSQISHLATILDRLGVMLANRTSGIWDLYFTTVQQQVVARMQKKWKEEQDAYDKAYNILVPGQQLPYPANTLGFADLLTEGILNKNIV